MKLSHLLEDAADAGDTEGTLRVLLASHNGDGKEPPPHQVFLQNIGFIRIDADRKEIGLVPAEISDSSAEGFTIAAARQMVVDNPEIAELDVISLVENEPFSGGDSVEWTCQVFGSRTNHCDKDIWLLLYPISQWDGLGAT